MPDLKIFVRFEFDKDIDLNPNPPKDGLGDSP